MKTTQFLLTVFLFFGFTACVTDLTTDSDPIDFTPSPKAKFRAYVYGKTVVLKNTSSHDSTWHWDFGNGLTSNLENPDSIYYDELGTYTISLTVKNGEKEDTHTETFEIRWDRINDFPGILRSRPVYFEHNDFWYYGLGQNDNNSSLPDWWKYRPSSDSWENLSPIDFEHGEGSLGGLVTTMGDEAYLLTRVKESFQNYNYYLRQYDIINDEWSKDDLPYELDTLIRSRGILDFFSYDQFLFLAIDQAGTGQMLVIKLNPLDLTYETELEIPCNGDVNYYFNAHVTGSNLYLLGSRLTYMYDFDSKLCVKLEGFRSNRTQNDFSSIALDDETFLIMGGTGGIFDIIQIPVFKSMMTIMLEYHPISKSVTTPPGGNLPYPNAGFALFNLGDEIIMVGGANSAHFKEVWKYYK